MLHTYPIEEDMAPHDGTDGHIGKVDAGWPVRREGGAAKLGGTAVVEGHNAVVCCEIPRLWVGAAGSRHP